MKTKTQFCPKGHDKDLVGRYSGGGCKKCNLDRAMKWNKEHSVVFDSRRRNVWWKHHGLKNLDGTFFTAVDYDRQYQIQQGKCLSCGIHQSELNNQLHADHDHKTGIFRFLLCMNCNRALGHAHDDPKVLRRLADLVEGISSGL